MPPPGLQRVSATSALNSSNKSVTVNCPAGKRVLGAGADINAGNGQVLFDDIRPNAALTAVTVQAVEDETGQSGPWSVTAYAVCADPIAGLERVATTSALDSTPNKFVTATCPAGKLATGVGGDINAGSGQVLFNVFDVGGAGSAVVQGTEDETGLSGPWSVTAYSICAPVTRRESTTSVASSDPKNVNLTCSFDDQQVTGLGGEVISGAQEVVLDRLRPDPPNNALASAFEDEGGFAGSWQLSSNAVCATPFPGQEIVSATAAQNSVAAKGITATCPGTKRVLGAAGEVVNGLGQIFLTSVRPSADLTGATAFAVEDENGTNASWGLVGTGDLRGPARRARARVRHQRVELGEHQVRDRVLPGREGPALDRIRSRELPRAGVPPLGRPERPPLPGDRGGVRGRHRERDRLDRDRLRRLRAALGRRALHDPPRVLGPRRTRAPGAWPP